MIQEIVESVQNLFGTRKIRRKPRILTKEEHQIDINKVSPFAVSVKNLKTPDSKLSLSEVRFEIF